MPCIATHFCATALTRDWLSNKKLHFSPDVCSIASKTCLVENIPCWKQCRGSAEGSCDLSAGNSSGWAGEGVEVLLCLQDSLWVSLAHLSTRQSMPSSYPVLWNSAQGALGGEEGCSVEPHGGRDFLPPRSLCPVWACKGRLRHRLGVRARCAGFTLHIPPQSPFT